MKNTFLFTLLILVSWIPSSGQLLDSLQKRCYTTEELRAIADTLLKGEEAKLLLTDCEEQNFDLQVAVDQYYIMLSRDSTKLDVKDTILAIRENQIDDLEKDLKKTKFWSTVAVVGLTILLILK